MTFLLRAYSDGDGDLTARVRCSAFTHEVKAVDFWRRLGRLLGPFVNSTRSFNPSNQGLFSTPARTDAERLTSKLHRASDSGGMCSRPVKQPSKVCVTVRTASSLQPTLPSVPEECTETKNSGDNKTRKKSGDKKTRKKAVAPTQAVALLAPLEAVLVAEGCLKDGDRLEPLSSAFPTRLTADYVFPTVDPEVCGRAASVHPA